MPPCASAGRNRCALNVTGSKLFVCGRWYRRRRPRATPAKFCRVKLLAFSDLHRDLGQAAELVAMSAEADVVIGAGDFASVHEGLDETIDALAAIETPTVLVPGNNETEQALREAASGWSAATVLHGSGTTIEGTEFYGLGAGIPVTPWEWSFDLDDEAASDDARRLPRECRARPPLAAARSLRQQRRRHALRQPRPAASDRREDAAAGRLRPHPRVLGMREPDRRARRSATSARRAPGSRSRSGAGGT